MESEDEEKSQVPPPVEDDYDEDMSSSSGSMTPRSTVSSYSEADSDEEEKVRKVDSEKNKKKKTECESAVGETGGNHRRMRSSYLSSRVAATDPLEVPEVLENIYKYLPLKEVRALRLVNKQWDYAALAYLRPKTKLTYDSPHKEEKRDLLHSLLKLNKTVPFSKFVTKFIPEEPDHLEEDFLETLGSQIKAFSIDVRRIEDEERMPNDVYEDLRFGNLMRLVMYNWVPNLEELELMGSYRNMGLTTLDKKIRRLKKFKFAESWIDGEKLKPLLRLCRGTLEEICLRDMSLSGDSLNDIFQGPFPKLTSLDLKLITNGNPQDLNCLWNNNINKATLDLTLALDEITPGGRRITLERPEWNNLINRILGKVKRADLTLAAIVYKVVVPGPGLFPVFPPRRADFFDPFLTFKIALDNHRHQLSNLTHLRLSVNSSPRERFVTTGIDFVRQMPNLEVLELHDQVADDMIKSLFNEAGAIQRLLEQPHLNLRELGLRTVSDLNPLSQVSSLFPNLKKMEMRICDSLLSNFPGNVFELFSNSSLEEITIHTFHIPVFHQLGRRAIIPSLKHLTMIYACPTSDPPKIPDDWASKMTNLISSTLQHDADGPKYNLCHHRILDLEEL